MLTQGENGLWYVSGGKYRFARPLLSWVVEYDSSWLIEYAIPYCDSQEHIEVINAVV